MNPDRKPLPVGDVRDRLPDLHEHLSRADADRLDRILPLFRSAADTRASLGRCLDAAYPDSKDDRQKQQAAFRTFRRHLAQAFAAAGLDIVLDVDSKKRSDAVDRRCWFSGPAIDPKTRKVESYSQDAAETNEPPAVEPMGVESRPRRRVCVLAAEANLKLARTLTDRLETQCAAQGEFDYRFWDRESVLAGEDAAEQLVRELARADVTLALVSPPFLADESLCSQIESARDLVPVLLEKLSPHHDRSCLGAKKLFAPGERPFRQCTGLQRDEFTRDLFEQIHERLRKGSAPPIREKQADKLALDRQAEGLTGLFDSEAVEEPIEGHGLRTQLGDDLARRPRATLEGVPMFAELDEWLSEPDAAAYAAVLGESGSGKTTLLKTLTLRLIERRRSDPNVPLPIYIDLRLYSPTIQKDGRLPGSVAELLDEILGHAGHRGDVGEFSGADILRMVRQEAALLIFDGLDEKLVHLGESEGLAFIRLLWAALPHTLVRRQRRDGKDRYGRLLFSCRSHYFKTLREQNGVFLGDYREGLDRRDYCAWLLLPFDEAQVREYLRRALGEQRVQPAIDLFRSVHNLSELAGRPLLLAMMTPHIAALEEKRARGEPVNGVTLYELLVDQWLARDAGKHRIGREDKVALMQAIAAAMWAAGQRAWQWTEVRDWLTLHVAGDALLTARYGKVDDVFEEDFRTATFVLRPGAKQDQFRFAHTSLQEYFLARHLRDRLLRDVLSGWDLPAPSAETLEFLGQLIAGEEDPARRRRCLAGLERLLGGLAAADSGSRADGRQDAGSGQQKTDGGKRATLNALLYWQRALALDLPEPAPRHVDLAGANLYGIAIEGRSPDRMLNLRGANFSGCNLRGGVVFRNVDLSDAELADCRAEYAEFLDVRAHRAAIGGAHFDGSFWRRCDLTGLQRIDTARLTGARGVRCRSDRVTRIAAAKKGLRWSVADASESGPLPDHAMLRVDSGHTEGVWSCAVTADGGRIVSGSADQTVRVWDATTGECLQTLSGHTGGVRSCAVTADGGRIVSGSDDRTVRVWDATTGECLQTLSGHTGGVRSCAVTADGGRIVSGSADQTVRVWDATTGECLQTLSGHTGGVLSCAVTADGGRIVSGSADQTVRVWDATTGECLQTLSGHTGGVRSCAVTADGGRIVSGSDDQTVRVWDATTGECLQTLSGHTGGVRSCAVTADGGRIVSGSDDRTVRVWDATTGECLQTLSGHTGGVWSCAVTADGGRIVSGSADQTVRVWDATTGECLQTLSGHTGGVWSCAVTADGGRIVSGSDDRTVRVWDATTGECLQTLSGHTGGVWSCAVTADGGRIVSGSADRTVRVWDATTGECLQTLSGHTGPVWSCAVTADGGRIVSGSDDQTVRVWDATTGECLQTLSGHTGGVWSCAVTADGGRIVSGSDDQTVRVWDATTGECLQTLSGHTDWVWSCAVTADGGRIVSGSADRTVRVWDATTGECLQTLSGHTGGVRSCAVTADGGRIVSGSADQTVRVWDATTGECLQTLSGHTGGVLSCAVTADGGRIVSGSADQTVRVWDATTGECQKALVSGRDAAASFDPAGNRVLWANEDGWRLLRWRTTDPETGEPRILPAEHFGPLPTTATA